MKNENNKWKIMKNNENENNENNEIMNIWW